MQKYVLTVVFMVSAAVGMVRSYALDPVQAQWSGWTRRGESVGQTLVCNFDTPVYAELFSGTATSQSYSGKFRTLPLFLSSSFTTG